MTLKEIKAQRKAELEARKKAYFQHEKEKSEMMHAVMNTTRIGVIILQHFDNLVFY